MVKVLTFRVHQNAIDRLDHFRHLLYFKSRSDMVRCAIIEAVYNTVRRKKKYRGRLEGKTKVIGCRLPEEIYQRIITFNGKQNPDTTSVWAAMVIYDWIEQIERFDERNLKSPVYHGLCQDFTHNYRPQVESLLLELNEMELAK